MSLLQNRFAILALRWALAGVFIYAGASKLGSPQNFSDSIATFSLLPNSLINPLALCLPPLEIIAGLAVITGILRRAALLGLTTLTFTFLVALAQGIFRSIPVDCGCFGSGKPTAYGLWIALGRDLLILATAAMLYFREASTASNEAAPKRNAGEGTRTLIP